MNITVELSIPDYIYLYYKNASTHIVNSSPEKIMSDALAGYVKLLSLNPQETE